MTEDTGRGSKPSQLILNPLGFHNSYKSFFSWRRYLVSALSPILIQDIKDYWHLALPVCNHRQLYFRKYLFLIITEPLQKDMTIALHFYNMAIYLFYIIYPSQCTSEISMSQHNLWCLNCSFKHTLMRRVEISEVHSDVNNNWNQY